MKNTQRNFTYLVRNCNLRPASAYKMHFFALRSKLVFRRGETRPFFAPTASVCVCLRTLSTSLSCALPKKEGRKNANSIKYNAEALAQAPLSLHPSLSPPLADHASWPCLFDRFSLSCSRCGFLFILNAFPTSTNTRTQSHTHTPENVAYFRGQQKILPKGFFSAYSLLPAFRFFVSLSALP